MLLRPPTPNIIILGALVHMEPFLPMMHTKRYNTWKMWNLKRFFRSYRAKFMKNKVMVRLVIITKIVFSLSQMISVFLKVKYCN